MVSLKPREGSISRGRKWTTLSKVAGRLGVVTGLWPVVREQVFEVVAQQKPDFVW